MQNIIKILFKEVLQEKEMWSGKKIFNHYIKILYKDVQNLQNLQHKSASVLGTFMEPQRQHLKDLIITLLFKIKI